MPIERFRITDQKCLVVAECSEVPALMVIAGPNGVGKSTLVFCLARRSGGEVVGRGEALYLGPHRVWRSGAVQQSWLLEREISFRQAMAEHHGPNLPGLSGGRDRDPSSADEVPAAMKYSLGQIERRRERAITRLVDLGDRKPLTGRVPDPYEPLRALTLRLLPHLQFDRVDSENVNNVRFVWRRQVAEGQHVEVEIDQLSSGEKEVLSLLMPFVEYEAQRVLRSIEEVSAEEPVEAPRGDVVVLVDEPELHLHPALQVRLMDYMRDRVAGGGVQFILATHSPTLMNAATFEELYVLTPPSAVGGNQLTRIASDADRLDAVRDVLGETHLATLSRSMVCVEGAIPARRSRKPSDLRVLTLLCPELASLVLLPSGGRSNAIETARKLRGALTGTSAGAGVFALVDRDDEAPAADEDWVLSLPVAEIENVLLAPRVIAKYLAPYAEKLPEPLQPLSDSAVERTLRQIARARRDSEVAMRLRRTMRFAVDFEEETVEALRAELEQKLGASDTALPSLDSFDESARRWEQWADGVLAKGEELKLFSGKEILQQFYVEFLVSASFGSYQHFVYEVARHTGDDEEARKAVRDVALRITYHLPARLAGLLERLRDSIAPSGMQAEFIEHVGKQTEVLVGMLSKGRSLREEGKPDGNMHAGARRDILKLMREVQEEARERGRGPADMREQLEALAEAAREIGTGPMML